MRQCIWHFIHMNASHLFLVQLSHRHVAALLHTWLMENVKHLPNFLSSKVHSTFSSLTFLLGQPPQIFVFEYIDHSSVPSKLTKHILFQDVKHNLWGYVHILGGLIMVGGSFPPLPRTRWHT